MIDIVDMHYLDSIRNSLILSFFHSLSLLDFSLISMIFVRFKKQVRTEFLTETKFESFVSFLKKKIEFKEILAISDLQISSTKLNHFINFI